MSPVPHLDAADVRALCTPAAATAALVAALRAGVDPALDPPRTSTGWTSGQLLVMPSQLPARGDRPAVAGVKVVTLAPDNPARGLDRIHGVYVVFDGTTLAPIGYVDGAAMTTLRTPSVSAAAVHERLAADPSPLRVVVFGAGPQGVGHVDTFRDVLAGRREVASVRHVVRSSGVPTPAYGDDGDLDVAVLRADDPAVSAAVADAGLVVCATGSGTPVLDSRDLREDAVVVAVGSHEPDRRELDAGLLGRACVVVEDVATALREAGDVVLAIAEGTLSTDRLVTLREVATGAHPLPDDRPVVFKSVGMAWEDLVVADAVLAARERAHPAQA